MAIFKRILLIFEKIIRFNEVTLRNKIYCITIALEHYSCVII